MKHPTIFNTADVAVITKMDLASAAEFDLAMARHNIQSVRPGLRVFEVSAKKGQGIDELANVIGSYRPASEIATAV